MPGRAATFEVGSRRYLVLEMVDGGREGLATLSASEQDVAVRLARGEAHAEIARARGVSPRTIANQVASIYRKLRIRSQAELGLMLAASADFR